ncbi:hypothetical protein ACLOJK_007894 [Asimina triloba]
MRSWSKMSRADRQQDKYRSSSSTSDEGTAARTRPFSFEEIMSRRKNKKLTEDDKGGAVEIRRLSRKENGESTSIQSEGLESKKDSVVGVTKHASKHYEKVISRTKEDGNSMKHKTDRYLEAKMKSKSSKERSKSDKDKGDRNQKQSHHSSRSDFRLRIDFEDESERKQPKDVGLRDKHNERNKSSHRESKRKHLGRNIEGRTSEADVNVSKRRDSGKRLEADHSERRGRGKESSQSYHEQNRPKRRRSRSWEHSRDRGRRSISTSPRAHKYTSYHGRDAGESTFRSFKDRSGKQHSDGDKNRMVGSGHGSGRHRHYGERTSGLGGYSPRKRRTEAAVRTPSPTVRSPERKIAAWDLAPEDVGTVSTVNNFRSSWQEIPSGTNELATAPTTTSSAEKPQTATPVTSTSTIKGNSFDSIQLTQATRPMRRLYIENLPATASDKTIQECLNDFLLSSGANHIQGTLPCISCIMNKEKSQAVVEFLTPEDATAALSLDGRSFAGSILKIRRPKDFVESAVDLIAASFQNLFPAIDLDY